MSDWEKDREIESLRAKLAEAHKETDSVVHARDEAYRMLAELERDVAPWRQLQAENKRLKAELAATEALCNTYSHALKMVSAIECVDDLWKAQDMLLKLPTSPTAALNKVIAGELRKLAGELCEGYGYEQAFLHRADELEGKL